MLRLVKLIAIILLSYVVLCCEMAQLRLSRLQNFAQIGQLILPVMPLNSRFQAESGTEN
jgi:hypothetical protein